VIHLDRGDGDLGRDARRSGSMKIGIDKENRPHPVRRMGALFI
jgi:hypothetical protein